MCKGLLKALAPKSQEPRGRCRDGGLGLTLRLKMLNMCRCVKHVGQAIAHAFPVVCPYPARPLSTSYLSPPSFPNFAFIVFLVP